MVTDNLWLKSVLGIYHFCNLLLYLLRLGFEPIFVKHIHRIHSKSVGDALVGIQSKVTLYSLLGPEYGGQTKDGGEGSKIRDWRPVKPSTVWKLRPLPTSDEEQVSRHHQAKLSSLSPVHLLVLLTMSHIFICWNQRKVASYIKS